MTDYLSMDIESYLFTDASSRDVLDRAKKLLLEAPEKMTMSVMESTFRSACICEMVEVAEWILSVNPEVMSNLKGGTQKLFREVCLHNDVEIAKLLLNADPTINISEGGENLFVNACVNNHLTLAQWTLGVRPDTNIMCILGWLKQNETSIEDMPRDEIVEWLKQVKPVTSV
jgi:hypothetical protein